MRRLPLLPLLVACAHRSDAPAVPTDAAPAHHGGEHGAHHGGAGHHGGHDGGHDGAAPAHDHRFEDPAAYAAVWESPERDAWQEPEKLVAALEIAPGATVADIGTGTGYLLPYLATAVGEGGTVLAVDLEPAMLKWVEERAARDGLARVKTVLATPTSPGLAPASVDRAVMVNVWHHIGDRVAYGKAVREALREGGRFYVVETRMDAPDGPPVHMRMTPEVVIADLTAAGLSAELSAWENARQYMVVARR